MAAAPLYGQRLSALAPPPDWAELEPFQETITRVEFVRLLEEVYAPRSASQGLIEVQDESARIRTTLAPEQFWTLRFARSAALAKPPPRSWRAPAELGAAPAGQPLAGVRIAIDPGHLGGGLARMEERWFRLGESAPVAEGDMTLQVAHLLAPRLRSLGAEVSLVRDSATPSTPARPEMMHIAARAELALQGDAEPQERTVQRQSELLFYRAAEIRARGTLVNHQLRPDLTLCLHFNAEPWGDPRKPELVTRNHFHVLINGSYSAAELRNDDVRFEMLLKLLSRSYPEELAASENVAAAFAHAAELPPYEYTTNTAHRPGQSAYVWARNLLANRVYQTPVVFLEPYVMNGQEVWERVQAGDYDGERMVAGKSRKSLFREYADAVTEGVRGYFEAARQ